MSTIAQTALLQAAKVELPQHAANAKEAEMWRWVEDQRRYREETNVVRCGDESDMPGNGGFET
jgi:hypothetical protein